MRSDETTPTEIPVTTEPAPDAALARSVRHLLILQEFRDAGEALAESFDRAGLAVKASAVRGALVILANQTIDAKRLAEPPYSAAILALHEITQGPAETEPYDVAATTPCARRSASRR